MRTSTLFVSFFRFLKRCCREATFSNGPGHLVVAGDAVRGDELEAIFRPQGATLICRLVPIEEPDLEAFGFPEFERDGPPAVAGFGRIARQRIVERVEKLLADRNSKAKLTSAAFRPRCFCDVCSSDEPLCEWFVIGCV